MDGFDFHLPILAPPARSTPGASGGACGAEKPEAPKPVNVKMVHRLAKRARWHETREEFEAERAFYHVAMAGIHAPAKVTPIFTARLWRSTRNEILAKERLSPLPQPFAGEAEVIPLRWTEKVCQQVGEKRCSQVPVETIDLRIRRFEVYDVREVERLANKREEIGDYVGTVQLLMEIDDYCGGRLRDIRQRIERLLKAIHSGPKALTQNRLMPAPT
ncbi:MAG TPA: hypothetical protein VHB73_04560 [Alphaproteobacteria bacterium]|nr:hypothetical protein [Alphaproteobacteria bacterium]